jgi:hypothetical protein
MAEQHGAQRTCDKGDGEFEAEPLIARVMALAAPVANRVAAKLLGDTEPVSARPRVVVCALRKMLAACHASLAGLTRTRA